MSDANRPEAIHHDLSHIDMFGAIGSTAPVVEHDRHADRPRFIADRRCLLISEHRLAESGVERSLDHNSEEVEPVVSANGVPPWLHLALDGWRGLLFAPPKDFLKKVKNLMAEEKEDEEKISDL